MYIKCGLHIFFRDGRIESYTSFGLSYAYSRRYAAAARKHFGSIAGVTKVNFFTGRYCAWPNGLDDGHKPTSDANRQLPKLPIV